MEEIAILLLHLPLANPVWVGVEDHHLPQASLEDALEHQRPHGVIGIEFPIAVVTHYIPSQYHQGVKLGPAPIGWHRVFVEKIRAAVDWTSRKTVLRPSLDLVYAWDQPVRQRWRRLSALLCSTRWLVPVG